MGGCQGTLVWKMGNLPIPLHDPNQVQNPENPTGNISNPVEILVGNIPNSVGDVSQVIRFSKNVVGLGIRRFTYNEIALATKQFTTKLGEGSFGTVFFGEDGTKKLAFKMRMPLISRGGNIEWKREVNYLGRLNHPNIVKVVGFCSENLDGVETKQKYRAVVYEYMTNRSLDKHIYSGAVNPLPWLQRMKIALDVAKGLAFIHNAPNPIIHRNLKTSDILLDEGFNAKISDFGCAKEGPIVEATNPPDVENDREGYLDPHYVETGLASNKTDVYAFGVVLLEMVAGRPVIERSMTYPKKNLVKWGRPILKEKKMLLKFIDDKMKLKFPPPSIEQVVKVAYTCLHVDPKKRPNMREIIQKLQYILANDTESGASGDEISPYESP